ncbi:hypothetical protein AAHA92_08053 [Salvia divinorum]|uniref:RING-type domain-containing protein n=1 Tax=Salvia divinorum TaxID=28513 RepID=A0ABD1HLZ1_SALDI
MEVVVGGVGSDEKLYTHNLRDFLRIKEEDHRRNLNQSSSSSSGAGRRSLTMGAFLSDKIAQPPLAEEPPRRSESSRTLLDIIREDQTAGLRRGRDDRRRSWRNLKDKIRLRRRITDNNNNNRHHHNQSDESIQPDSRAPIPLRNPRRSTESATATIEPSISPPMRQSTADDNGNANVNEAAEAAPEGNGSPVRMSLMALLAENDRQMGYESSAYAMDEDEPEEDVNRVIEETGTSSSSAAAAAFAGGKGAESENCCVCMVRHKGAAFIPCGHTFCRLCSRELWVQRGNCPLCNNFIVEILDIF